MILVSLVLCMFMAAVDTSVLATITPHIISSIGQMHLYPLLSAVFLFAFVVITPVFGLVADYWGCKKAGSIAIFLFLLGSFLSGCSNSMQQLIAFRFIQGLGAGGLVNVCFVTIGRVYPSDTKRSFMQAVLSSVWTIASIIGPLIGAALTTTFSWRAVFWMNIPLGIVAIVLLLRFQESHVTLHERVDTKGILLFVLGSALTFFSFSQIADRNFSFMQAALFILGLLLFSWFSKHAWENESAFIPLRLLKNKGVLACILLGLLSGGCLTTASTLMSFYLQGAVRETITHTGFVIAALSIGWTIGSFFCSALLHKLGLRNVSVIAIVLLTIGFLFYAAANPACSLGYFLLSSSIFGCGMGIVVNSTITGIMRAVSHTMIGRATSFLSLIRSMGMSIGASVSGYMQLFYFRSYLLERPQVLSEEVINELLTYPEKLLESDFTSSMTASQLNEMCLLFGKSIEAVFVWPVVILVFSLALVILIPKRQSESL